MWQILYPEEFGKAFVPKLIRRHLRGYFLKTGMTEVPYSLFGSIFYGGLFTAVLFFLLWVYPRYISSGEAGPLTVFVVTLLSFTFVTLGAISLFTGTLYFYFELIIFQRTKQMEVVLPDFLRYVSENLKGGMPFEKALWSAIKPEFGVLANEVRLAAKRVMTGQDVDEALREFTMKYNSPLMRRSFDLIIEGIRSGGKVADLIDRVVENLEETRELKEDMRATNLTYVIFLFAIVVVVAPLLFTLSYFFVQIVQGFADKIGTGASAADLLPINFSDFEIDIGVFQQFSHLSLATMSFFSAAIVSIISTGSVRGGMKYFPIFLISSQVVYLGMVSVAGIFFSGFFLF